MYGDVDALLMRVHAYYAVGCIVSADQTDLLAKPLFALHDGFAGVFFPLPSLSTGASEKIRFLCLLPHSRSKRVQPLNHTHADMLNEIHSSDREDVVQFAYGE